MRRALLALALGVLAFPSAAHASLQPPSLSLDATFAPPSGLASDNLTDSSSDQASDAAYFNGRTYTVGSATIGGDTGVAIIARRANGTLDPGFSDDGKLVLQIAPGTEADKAGGIVVLPDGRLRIAVDADVMVGSDTNKDIVLLGLNPDGSYDQAFGGGTGIVQITIGPKDDTPSRLAVDALGRIAVTGLHDRLDQPQGHLRLAAQPRRLAGGVVRDRRRAGHPALADGARRPWRRRRLPAGRRAVPADVGRHPRESVNGDARHVRRAARAAGGRLGRPELRQRRRDRDRRPATGRRCRRGCSCTTAASG